MPASRGSTWCHRNEVSASSSVIKERTLFAALFSRLRRAEVVILHLTMKLTVRDTLLDKLLSDMLDLSSVDEPSGSGSPDGGDEVPVPLQGSPDGEDKGTSDAQE